MGITVEKMGLCLFLQSGKTFTFRDVYIRTDNESVLVFDYMAMSDEKIKRICVQKSQIVGWSYYVD